MEIFRLIVELIGAIIWPVSIVFILYLYKEELVNIIERLQLLKYRNFEAQFRNELNEVESNTKKLNSKAKESLEKKQQGELVDANYFDRLRQLAELSPRGAILEAWLELESVMRSYLEESGLDMSNVAPNRIILHLSDERKIHDNIIDTLTQVRNLRNNAVHMSDYSIKVEEAIQYINAIEALILHFKSLENQSS